MPQKTKQHNPGPIYSKLFGFLWPQILFLKTQFFISTLTFFVLWNLICDGFEFGFSSWNQSLIVLGLHKVQSLPQALSLRFTHSLPFFNFLKLTTLYFPSLQKKKSWKSCFLLLPFLWVLQFCLYEGKTQTCCQTFAFFSLRTEQLCLYVLPVLNIWFSVLVAVWNCEPSM